MNAWHYLRPSKGAGTATNFVYFDTETRRIPAPYNPRAYNHVLRLGVAYSSRREGSKFTRGHSLEFTTASAFWSFLDKVCSPRRKTYVFAHNLLFDLGVLGFWKELEEMRITLQADYSPGENKKEPNPLVVLSSPPVIIGAKLSTGAGVTFIDSLNYVRLPLAVIAKRLGMVKPDVDFERASEAEIFARCRADVDILRAMIERIVIFQATHKLGGLRYTASATALSSYKAYMPEKTICVHDDMSVKALERTAFIASEIECYRIGRFSGRFHMVDSNSLYPSVMVNNRFPVKLLGDVVLDGVSIPPSSIDLANCIADVQIESPRLAVNCRVQDLSMRCKGSFRTVLPGPDLVELSRLGLIKSINRLAVYSMADIFTDYISELARIRDNYRRCGKEFESMWAKLLANSLFGKFGQRNYSQVFRADRFPPRPFCNWVEIDSKTRLASEFYSVGWKVFQKVDRVETETSSPAIAAFVTSYARAKMASARHFAGLDNVYYQGVDGLIVNETGYANLGLAGLLSETELGLFKTVYSADEIEIRGTCDYSIGSRHIVGRVPRQVLSRDGNKVTVRKFYVPRPDQGLAPKLEVLELIEELTLSKRYRKGPVDDAGRVSFFTLPGDLPAIVGPV